MKTVILAGGRGSRFGSLTRARPKAMLTIGGIPILAHIMRTFVRQRHREFVVATGYQAGPILDYFSGANDVCGDPLVTRSEGCVKVTSKAQAGLEICLVDTGADTGSAGRLARLETRLDDSAFFLAWCDGLADIDCESLVTFHRNHAHAGTVVAVRPPPRFGRLTLDGDSVTAFEEKPDTAKEWINAGLFVLEPRAMNYIVSESEMLEAGPLPRMAAARELLAYRHEGFWDCMDTPADRQRLEHLWQSGDPPWNGSRARS